MNKPSIPLYWSAEEALTFVAFLEDIVSNIWSIHGSNMAMHLQQVRQLQDRAPQDRADPKVADDIPF